MRKLLLQVQMSLDGFIAGPNGEMDWMTWNWDDDLKQYVADLMSRMDCIVLGRKLAEGFIPYWADVAFRPDDPQYKSGKIFTDTPKIVFSQTLESSPWDNTTLAEAQLVEEIGKLKAQDGKDIIAYGGATFVSNLITHGLIDEYHLFVNPAIIGNGMTIFADIDAKKDLQLSEATAYDCGIAVLKYEPKS